MKVIIFFIINEQHIFRNKHSTTTALAHLLNHITSALDNKKIFRLFLDLSRAFDSINHSVLIKKKLEFYEFVNYVFVNETVAENQTFCE